MNIDRETLSARSWAIPAISGLLILHHDFKTPRLAKVNRLVWSESSVDVYLQYGICNVSGKVIDSTDIVVTLHREGAVGIKRPLAAAGHPIETLLTFLAGEVFRESHRWAEDMESWGDDEKLDMDRASILSIVSALVAYPFLDVNVSIEKDALKPACIRKARLSDVPLVIEITPAGWHGVNLDVKCYGTHAGALKRYQQYDMRQASAQAKTLYARFLKGASFRARQLMLLPWDTVLYLSERKQNSEMNISFDLVKG